jgi:hypothetical protein
VTVLCQPAFQHAMLLRASCRYKLRDFFEADMWNSTEMIETEPPSYMARITGLWEIGNEVLNGKLTAACNAWAN